MMLPLVGRAIATALLYMVVTKKKVNGKINGLVDFNLNSILVIAAGVVTTWLVNDGLSTVKEAKQASIETNKSVIKIETALPYIAKSQDRLENEVKQVKEEQGKVRDELSKR